jgi:uncharacterized protein (TIGR02246 family)
MNLKWIWRVAIGLILAAPFIVGCVAQAQSQADETAVRNVPQTFAAAWTKHDGQQLGKIMSENVDFVDVAGDWLRGRSDFALYHSRLLSGRFRDSTLTPLATSVRFLRPDLAVLHWSWRIEGDRNFDATSRKPRFGLFTMIVEKTNGKWLVTVAQNTNRIPPPNQDPEMEGIKAATLFPLGQ